MKRIPLNEIHISFARSGGPGGQNVNKRETKVVAMWHIDRSSVFSFEERARIHSKLSGWINKEGYLLVDAQQTRSQSQNIELAIQRLQELVHRALIIPKKRKPTKPSRASKKRRIESKRKVSDKKLQRRSTHWE